MPKRLFLSYSHIDQPFVLRLAKDLDDAGLDVWIDKWRLKPGDKLVQSIGEGIGTSDYFLPVLSPSFIKSHFAQRELDEALVSELGERRVKVVPILAKKCAIPSLLRSIIYADFSGSYTSGLENLAGTLGVEVPSYPVTVMNESATLTILNNDKRFRITHSRVIEVREADLREFTDLHVFSDTPPVEIRVNSGHPRVETQTGLHRIVTGLPKPLPVRRPVRRTVSYEGFDRDERWFYRLQSSFMWARVCVRFASGCDQPSLFESHFDRDGFQGVAPPWRIVRRDGSVTYTTRLSPEMARWRTLLIHWQYDV
jgi:hypothetical protein